ncbi:MAG: hypothetical protein ABR499_12265 [Gemmatimonadaceae bacterium]
MSPPTAGLGPSSDERDSRGTWLTPDRQGQVRTILLALVLFFGLVVWVFHSVAAATERAPEFVHKLRVVGVMTWIYALVQLVDMRFYHSRFARRRRASLGIPENLIGWLFGQMLAWFGIVYYGLTDDMRWYVAGLVLFGVTCWVFPIPAARDAEAQHDRTAER